MTHLTMVGSGNLTKTFILGWTPHLSTLDLTLSVLARSHAYRDRGWGSDLVTPSLSPDVLSDADVIVVSVKPKDRALALSQIQTYAPRQSLVVSVMAGISQASLRAELPGREIVRTMPNIGVAVGDGTLVVAEGPALNHPLWPWLQRALEVLGRVVLVPEALIDPATAVSGSGPAYIFLLVQAIANAGETMGIPSDRARELALYTVRGAAEVALAHPTTSFEDLIRWVASPGGTTEAALDRLRRLKVGESLQDAVLQAGAKAAGLSHTPTTANKEEEPS